MKKLELNNPGKVDVTWINTAHKRLAVLLFVFGFLLLYAHNLQAETSSGMINRAPLNKVATEPTALEKISSDLNNIIKSINQAPDDAEESTVLIEETNPEIEKETVIIEEVKPKKKAKAVVADPGKPNPTQTKTVRKKPVNKPVIVKQEKPVVPDTQIVKAKPIEVPVVKVIKKATYLKLSAKGEELKSDTTNWSCVSDTRNGLMWEVKTNDGGMRDKQHLYSWFDPSLREGISDGGRCKGKISCDTYAYVKAVNRSKLCGHDDWRLPTREEMQSLVYFDNSTADTRINIKYFPETLPSWYWTASSNEDNPDYAWYVLFRNGISLNDLKKHPKHIRLVRKDNGT